MWFVILLCSLLLFKFILILTTGRCKSKVCLVGKTALITGGNAGIGLEVAYHLASRGCRVIIADKDDATESKEAIIKETHNPNIVAKIVDFRSFKSVRAFAKDINETEAKLDILINNAGLAAKEMVLTEDGLSRTLQVNYFSHFLLTHLLIGLLKKSAPSRIIFNSSISAYFPCKLNVSDLTRTQTNPKEWKISFGAYANSKLLMAVAAVVLTEKLKGSGVTANVLHPGIVHTKIFKLGFFEDKNPIIYGIEMIARLFGKTIEESVETLIYAACENNLEKVSGKFFMDCRQVWHPSRAKDVKFCKEIWDASEKAVKLEKHEKL